MAYNDDHSNDIRFRRLFVPSLLGLVGETMLAIAIILTSFAADIQTNLLGQSTVGQIPSVEIVDNVIDWLSELLDDPAVRSLVIFLAWLLVFMMIYVLVFRLCRLIAKLFDKTKKDAANSYLPDSEPNLFYLWLSRLEAVFFRISVIAIGVGVVAAGFFLSLVYAYLMLETGFSELTIANVFLVAAGFLATTVGIRVVLMGLALMSKRLRIWYLS